MNKQEFLVQLRNALSGLPKDDIEERIEFYSEMIEDRIEEGLSEEEAIASGRQWFPYNKGGYFRKWYGRS